MMATHVPLDVVYPALHVVQDPFADDEQTRQFVSKQMG